MNPPIQSIGRARLILYALFALSGAAGLIYEMIWSRYLALFLGHSAYSQVLVIAIFLGGMALGALLVGSRSERLQDPLKWYVGAELVVGLIGLFFHEVYGGAVAFAYDSVFPLLAGTVGLTLFKWTVAACLILPQSILLGATFPLMAAGVLRRNGGEPGRVLSLLYFTNSFGGAVGVLVAGFYLINLAGLPGTLLVAAMGNLVVALVSLVLARRYPAAEQLEVVSAAPQPVTAGREPAPRPLGQMVKLLLGVSFGTAVASFAYEIGWLRMLSLVLGSATHSFELMLSAFILGLALGALWVRRRADRWGRPLRTLAIVQLAMGAAAMATLALYGASFSWMSGLLHTFARSDAGYAGFTLARYAICLAIMFPACFFAGMTLPLITRTLLVAGAGERTIGRVYGFNTLGAIVGVAGAGLVLMPWVGLKGLIVGGAALDMALGAVILVADAGRNPSARRLAYAGLGFTVLALVVGVVTKDFDHRILSSGVYRNGNLPDAELWEELSYKDGRTATVTASRITNTGTVAISTNGKTDASLRGSWLAACSDTTTRQPLGGDVTTQILAPLITLAHAPKARLAAVVGQGSGMSSHYLLASPHIDKLVTVEIEPEMVRGSRAFYPANRRVFEDPRSEIVIEDAKAYFSSQPQRYDLIFSEPSNPWVSGIASLFGTEFYAHVRRYMAEDGVFGQWMHLYSMNDGLVLSVLAAIHHNFPSYEVFLTNGLDMLVVASNAPSLRPPDWSILDLPAMATDLCHTVPATPAAMEATRLTHRRALAPLLDGWEGPNSDFYPVLDLSAERARFVQRRARGFMEFPVQGFEFTAPFFGRRQAPGLDGPVLVPSLPRMRLLALAGLLRDAGAGELDTAGFGPALQVARYRQQQWEAIQGSGRPPPAWEAWLQNFMVVERDLHAGTAGYVDEGFYSPVFAYLDRYDAPTVVRSAVAFRYGLAKWDFERAATAARALLDEDAHEKGFVRSEDLFSGGVIALLRTGDVQGAGQLFERLKSKQSDQDDLRVRLVEAYLDMYRSDVPTARPAAGSGVAGETAVRTN